MNQQSERTLELRRYYNELPIYNKNQDFDSWISQHKSLPIFIGSFIFAFIFILSFIIINKEFNVNYIFLFIILILTAVFGQLRDERKHYKVYIDSSGIEKTYSNDINNLEIFLSWEQIEYIRVIPQYNGTNAQVIYIKNITNAEEKSNEKTYKIVMPYSPKAAHCITNYWNKKIENLDQMNSWIKYTKKINYIK